MHVDHLSLTDFRSYPQVELPLAPGVTSLVGPNGQGKTNLVEAIGYVATLGSHRVSTDAPLVRAGAERAVVRAGVVRGGRRTLIELELTPGRANRARLNRSPVPRPREVLGVLRTVLFAPEDLALVKGDPDGRRRFLDDLLVARAPRLAGVRADYDRVLKQRNALLKSARTAPNRRRRRPESEAPVEQGGGDGGILHTLDVWDDQLATVGSQLLASRLRLVHQLVPPLTRAYQAVSGGKGEAVAGYVTSLGEDLLAPEEPPGPADLRVRLADALVASRAAELERGVTLVGPHRDDLALRLGELPAKGYASHGESWSFALALRLASYELLTADGGEDGEPVLVLDDVFAELDTGRRQRLAALVAPAEQVLVTAAVPGDIPADLIGDRVEVGAGTVSRGD